MTLPDIPRNPAVFKPKDPRRFQPRGDSALHLGPIANAPVERAGDEFSANLYGSEYGQPEEKKTAVSELVEYTPSAFPWPLWIWSGVSLAIVGLVAFLILR